MTIRIHGVAVVVLVSVLSGACDRSPDHLSNDIAISIDGGKEVMRHVEWRCSYRSNRSPANFGPTHSRTYVPVSVESFNALPDGREALVMPRQEPGWATDERCVQFGAKDWSAYVIDSRSSVSRLFFISSGAAPKGPPGYKLPALSVRTLATSVQPNPPPDAVRAARDAFAGKVCTISRLVVEEPGYFLPDGNPNPKYPDDTRFLLSLPSDRPTVILPKDASLEPVTGKASPSDLVYEDLPLLRHGDSEPLPMQLLPSANGEPITFDVDRATPYYDRQGNANPSSNTDGYEVFYLGKPKPPEVLASGIAQPIPIAASAVIWYPDRKRLFLIWWMDDSKVVRGRMLHGLEDKSTCQE